MMRQRPLVAPRGQADGPWTPASPTATCLVADDHPALVAAVADFLGEHGFEILGPVADGVRALALAEAERPDLALVDFRMPRLGGTELVRRLKETDPGLRVAVYTAEAEGAAVTDLLEAGADAIVLKEAPLADLVRALESILGGRPYVDSALARDALGGRRASSPKLTPREVEVLALLAEGLSHEQIGKRLSISAETVRTHLGKACDRLDAATRTQAVATALRRGLIS